MTEPIATRDGQTIAAWLLKSNPERYDALGAFEAFGVIDGFSVHETYRLDLMEEGQRCFLYVGGDEGGIWGVGEVTGPVYTAHVEDDGFYVDEEALDEVRRFVPVEILRLANPIPRAELLARPELAECELFRSPQQGNPNVLRPDEVAALESFDLTVIEPTEEQLENLAALHDPTVLVISDGPVSYGIDDLGDDDSPAFRVIKAQDDEVEELGTFEKLDGALGALTGILDEIAGRAPIHDIDHGEVDVEPIVVVATDDGGTLTIARLGESAFAGFHQSPESEEVEILEGYSSASEALLDLIGGDMDDDD